MRFRTATMVAWVGAGFLLAGLVAGGESLMGEAHARSVPERGGAGSEVEDVRTGRILFEENCVACHQSEGTGQAGLAPSLISKEFLAAASDRFLRSTILDGREGTNMVPFRGVLSTVNVDAIIAYLRSHNRSANQGMAVDQDRQAMGDPRLGKRWFAQICAGCHGVSGEGYLGAGSGTAIGSEGFLSNASDGYIRYIIKHGRSNTAMRGFAGPDALADLTEAEIDDIISYLRILE